MRHVYWLKLAVLLLALPAFPQHGVTPGGSHGKPGPQILLPEGDVEEPAGPLDDVYALYTFDEETVIWAEGGDALVTYAFGNDGTNTILASADDSAALSGGASAVGFTVCAWGRMNAATDDDVWVKKDDYSDNREWTLRMNNTTPGFYVSHSCDTYQLVEGVGAISADERVLVCGIYDKTSQKVRVYQNGTLGDESAALSAAGICDGAAPFNVGGMTTDGGNKDGFDGDLGPLYWWNGAVKDETALDALWDNGRGKDCATAVAADATMTRCWDLDEDPTGGAGAYKDEVTGGTSDNLTPTNSPSRATPGVIMTGDGEASKYLDLSGSVVAQADDVSGVDDVADFDASLDKFVNPSILLNQASLSISAWVYRSGNPSANAWWLVEATSSNPGYIAYGVTDGKHLFGIRTNTSTDFTFALTAAAIGDTVGWVHVCGYTTVGEKVYLRINGGAATAESAGDSSGATVRDASVGIRIGSAVGPTNEYFGGAGSHGYLDDVAFWNTNIGSSGCDAIYAAGSGKYY